MKSGSRKLRRTPEGLLLHVHLKSGLEARFHHPFFLPSGLSSCEPRKRKPALFPASPSPQEFGLCTGCSGKKAKTKAKTILFHKYKTLKPPTHQRVCHPGSRGTQPRAIASGPGCGRIGVGPLWLFQCAGIWIRIIRKSEPGERARIWRVRQVRTFLW